MSKIKNIARLLKDFMELDDEHIYLYNQKLPEPKDKKLYVVVALDNTQVVGNNSRIIEIEGECAERIETVINETIRVEVYSYGFEAIARKEEVLQCLKSTQAELDQEAYSYHIATLPTTFSSVPDLDGMKILNRFSIVFNVLSKTSIQKETDYLDGSDYELFINN